MLSIIVSIAKNWVIGIGNRLPWQGQVPADMRYFKRTTYGHPVIMGRRTWESIPLKFRPLDGRRNIVLSGQPELRFDGAEVFPSLEAALAAAEDATEVFVIGGGRLYEQALPIADRLYVTYIDGKFEGDTYFPELDLSEWELISRDEQPQDEKNKYACTFAVYQRKGGV